MTNVVAFPTIPGDPEAFQAAVLDIMRNFADKFAKLQQEAVSIPKDIPNLEAFIERAIALDEEAGNLLFKITDLSIEMNLDHDVFDEIMEVTIGPVESIQENTERMVVATREALERLRQTQTYQFSPATDEREPVRYVDKTNDNSVGVKVVVGIILAVVTIGMMAVGFKPSPGFSVGHKGHVRTHVNFH